MKSLILISASMALSLSMGAAHAATFTVTSTADTDGTACGSVCTLRQAINAANASAGADTINFSISGTVNLGSALPVVTDTLAIDGTGRAITLSGGGAVQVLQVNVASALALNSLTIADGRASEYSTAGGLTVLAIPPFPQAGANVSVANCVFSGNAATGSFTGGAIMMGSFGTTLTVSNSTFTGNSALPSTGEPAAGAIYGRSINITNSTFENNSGTTGAIRTDGGTLTVSGSTFAGNSATNSGGAISASPAGTITNSTFYGNSAAIMGGAIRFHGGFDIAGLLTVTNSTFFGNTSNTGNIAGLNGAILASPKAILRNSVVANSTNGNCNSGISDGGGNVSDDATCVFTTATSLANTPAQLGPLQNNGGPTRTMAPLTGSPAIDQGVNQLAIDAGLTTDQRGAGFPRISPTGGTVDRGAFEVQVDSIPPSCTAGAKPGTLFNATHKLVNIATTVTARDNNPGVTFALRSVTSSEADSGLGRSDVPFDIQGWTVGSADLAGQLRNEYFSRAGRIYTITYQAKDAAGNTAACSAKVTVPYRR